MTRTPAVETRMTGGEGATLAEQEGFARNDPGVTKGHGQKWAQKKAVPGKDGFRMGLLENASGCGRKRLPHRGEEWASFSPAVVRLPERRSGDGMT